MDFYYNRQGEPISQDEAMEFLKNDFDENRQVAKDEIGDVMVSTVFLVFDHGIGPVPILFETMVFGGDLDGQQWRYATEEEALGGHQAVLELAT